MGEKRIRRSFQKCIMDRVEERYMNINDAKVNQLFKKISEALDELEELRKGGRMTKMKMKILSSIPREQLEQYIENLKKQAKEQ